MPKLLDFNPQALEKLTDRIQERSNILASRIAHAAIAGEVPFSGHICGEISGIINMWEPLALNREQREAYGGRFIAEEAELHAESFFFRQASSNKKDSEEFISGADIIVGYNSQVEGIDATKGFLAQSKILKTPPDGMIRITERRDEFRRQCRRMLRVTTDAYAWIYTTKGVLCYPATRVLDLTGPGVPIWESRPIGDVFYDFLICNMGHEGLYGRTESEFREFVASQMKNRPEDIETETLLVSGSIS